MPKAKAQGFNTTRRAYRLLAQAHGTFESLGDAVACDGIEELYRRLSGGCYPDRHQWPVSGPLCCCGLRRWRN